MGDKECLRQIHTRITSSFRGNKTAVQFNPIYEEETLKRVFEEFIADSDIKTLFITRAGDKLTASVELPPIKKKALFFLKDAKVDSGLKPEDFGDLVIFGELSEAHIQSLHLIAQEVYFPLLSNPANRGDWSGPTAKEVMLKFSNFLATLTMTAGQQKGKTLLPHPPPEAFETENLPSKERMFLLENTVLTWTNKIEDVLKTSPEIMLLEGKNADPIDEIEFWEEKATDLSSLHEQLKSQRMKEVLETMQALSSSLVPSLLKVSEDVVNARNEALENARFLNTMNKYFSTLRDEPEFDRIEETFYPIMHCILLIWKHSTTYNTPVRLTCLVQEICNAIIKQGLKFISGASVFRAIEDENIIEAISGLQTCRKVCERFVEVFARFKIKAAREMPNTHTTTCKVEDEVVFARLNLFLERIQDIMDFTNIVQEFSKLEKIVIGGTKGKQLSDSIMSIFKDFNAAVDTLQQTSADHNYDIMDINFPQFDDDYYQYSCRVKDLERRLSSVLSIAFDDCATIYAHFKLLDSFEGLLQRPIIKDELDKKRNLLLQIYAEDLAQVQSIFLTYKDNPRIDNNLPPVAGRVSWCRGLYYRDIEPYEKLKQFTAASDRQEYKEIEKMHVAITKQLLTYESEQLEEWKSTVDACADEKLAQPLLRKVGKHLVVNFDPALIRLLREVKYFISLEIEVVSTAMTVYEKAEQYRTQIGTLELIVAMYNEMIDTLEPVEKPLVSTEISAIDEIVQQGIVELNWTSPDVNKFINLAMEAVKTVYDTVKVMKGNFEQIVKLLADYSKTPLVERKNKTQSTADFEEGLRNLQKTRHERITQIQTKVTALLMETLAALKAKPVSPTWRAYQEYVQDAVSQGLADTIVNSIKYLSDQLNIQNIEKNKLVPLLEIQLGLYHVDVLFTCEDTARDGLDDHKTRKRGRTVWEIVNDWVEGFFEIGNIMTRMDGSHYVGDLKKNDNIVRCINEIKKHNQKNQQDCENYKLQFSEYEFLWKQDRKTEFNKFLADALAPETKDDEEEEEEEDDATAVEEDEDEMQHDGDEEDPVLPLDKFQAKIEHFKEYERQIDEKANIKVIGWLKISSLKIKNQLKTEVNQWINTYTSHLYNDVTRKLTQLDSLITDVKEGLRKNVEEDDSDGLKRVLDVIHQVRSKERAINDKKFFNPLKETVQLLKRYGRSLDEYETRLLNDAPIQWTNTVDHIYKVKEKVNKLQNQEVHKINERVEDFALECNKFREEFKSKAPFRYRTHVDDAYDIIYEFHHRISEKFVEAEKLNDLEKVFELTVTKHTIIKRNRTENKLLKQVWDMISLVQHQFDFWKKTLWDDINADDLTMKTKAIRKAVNTMPPEVRGWDCYQGLADEVKNFLTVLASVQQLASKNMGERHWQRLKDVTGKQFTKDSTFALSNILDLELHKYVNDVEYIVELANKEARIGGSLDSIEDAWKSNGGFELTFSKHEKHPEINIISGTDEIIQFLTEHQANLQSMAGQGTYVEFFLAQVTAWQSKLNTVESVLNNWLDVQAKWGSLESIFLGSKDIQEKLAAESKMFIETDKEFKDLMKAAVTSSNVIEAVHVKGRGKALKTMIETLIKCEKALFKYLEDKRKIFARFYFLPDSALLEILSNGTNPPEIQQFMGDCFDNIKKLKFAPAPEGEIAKTATHMYSKDGGECVPFHTPFECLGPAEEWLNGLVDAMKDSLKEKLAVARFTAEHWQIEKPREKWLYDYPAQIALTASQIIWTDEVEQVFDAFADGNETAMKDYSKNSMIARVITLVNLVLDLGLTKELRVKIITLITVDVHNRDVVQKLIDGKTTDPLSFAWQSQMRYSWNNDNKECTVIVADALFNYSYEYVGNTGRLVITPLTDRCYITLTQALRLIMGGAPAGPAGTGKTETTKDLGRGMGLPVYVFNCSEQMNVESMAAIYKGLAMTGAWGCFDEFNRIPIEVLSVVSTQVACILNAIKAKKTEFLFGDAEEPIPVIHTVGMFITMNPGYAGRTELPENLKSLFRSCAMVVPDMELICENMLLSEGFLSATRLAKKFVTLYGLSKELLSKQMHYDWGLRATKAVLRVAGGLKRAEIKEVGPENCVEDEILLRALRDFNLPKLVDDDKPIFVRLIEDLFPEFKNVQRKMDMKLKAAIDNAAIAEPKRLQKEASFTNKCVELFELLGIRHSVFVIGPAGSAKSECIATLMNGMALLDDPVVYEVINPKSIRNDELYGWLSKTDWNDGVLSKIMRSMARNTHGYKESQANKWIIFDGDIDPEWIESLNTVMDDNKVLTLVSKERIPLSAAMRLIFEIADLKQATPATVSRAGIIFINAKDVGSRPFLESWIERRDKKESSNLLAFNRAYCGPDTLSEITRSYPRVVPLSEINLVQTMCHLLEGMLDLYAASKLEMEKRDQKISDAKDKEIFECIFVWSCIWGFAGGCPERYKQTLEVRKEFSRYWRSTFTNVKFPSVPKDASVFDFYVNFETGGFEHWSKKVDQFNDSFDPMKLKSVFVPTTDTFRTHFVIDLLVPRARSVLLVGTAGTGKTVSMGQFLKARRDVYSSTTINLNFFTDAKALQSILEGSLTKRVGRSYGPIGTKKLIYFIDDLNMPRVDKYGTQSPSALIRQHMNYQMWYDTTELVSKTILDVQYVAGMNPTSGSFNIHPRLQGNFRTFAATMPSKAALASIYGSLLRIHLGQFSKSLHDLAPLLTEGIILLNEAVTSKFIPSTRCFHYQFNLRDLSNIAQGICNSIPKGKYNTTKFIKLWWHECTRVYADRFVQPSDTEVFHSYAIGRMKGTFKERAEEVINPPKKEVKEGKKGKKEVPCPLLFCSFMNNTGSPIYNIVPSLAKLKVKLTEALVDYNENNPAMPLELFKDAMEHVCRIARIIEKPNGNAMLVGVGGSGKQSLSRLASSICAYDVFQISVSQTYGINDLKADLQQLYLKAGVKNLPTTFLLTDGQIVDDAWLVFVNDLLSSGYIHELFDEEETDGIFNSLRNEAKAADVEDNRVAMQEFFISKVKTNLHMVLCFSPVGEIFRKRCQKFPALINCTTVDWFFPWPQDALISVADRFLSEVEFGDQVVFQQPIAEYMAEVHLSVKALAVKYLEMERRYVYSTPKSFLELIAFYKKFLTAKRLDLEQQTERLQKGIYTLMNTQEQVAELRTNLAGTLEIVRKKGENTAKMIERMGVEQVKVQEQQAIATQEAKASKVIADRADETKARANKALSEAAPLLVAAQEAVGGLDKSAITEFRGFGTVHDHVQDVAKATLLLLGVSWGKDEKNIWPKMKNTMGVGAAKFVMMLTDVANKAEHIDPLKIAKAKPVIEQEHFNQKNIAGKSFAASNLCLWCISTLKYNEVSKFVTPLKEEAGKATALYDASSAKLASVEAHVAGLRAKLATLRSELQDATEEKAKVEKEAQDCQDRLGLAKRLVDGLADENERWGIAVKNFKERERTLIGDVLLGASFVSYIGAFNQKYRLQLWQETWIPVLESKKIPLTPGIDPLKLLASDSDFATWKNEGLASDRISLENGALVTLSDRWPLMIDPQLQGIKWIKSRTKNLRVIQLNQDKFLKVVIDALNIGQAVLIESAPEEIDATLDPVLSRSTIKRGAEEMLLMGGKEVPFSKDFKLIIQTKLANPHYKPEIAAQCTLINFIVTEEGLEDQLLALVVNKEKPELELQRTGLVRAINEYITTLINLENDLLKSLSEAPDDILSDESLIIGLEKTKQASTDIAEKVKNAQRAEITINATRNEYRNVASEGSWIFFLIIDLNIIDWMYQYSLDAFTSFFLKAMQKAPPADTTPERVMRLRETIRMTVFSWVNRGMFEKHKLILTTQLCFKLMQKNALKCKLDAKMYDYLIRGPRKTGTDRAVDWLAQPQWDALAKLVEYDGFEKLLKDIEASPNRFKEWFNKGRPEAAPLPLEWRKLDDNDPFKKLLIVRAMRVDRMTTAMESYVRNTLPDGRSYTESDAGLSFNDILNGSFEDSTPHTPIFFILSPGADPVNTLETIAKKMDMYDSGGIQKFHRVALGQGQDVIAEGKLREGHSKGWWIVLENIHLMPRWCAVLEKMLDDFKVSGNTNPKFRVFLSAEPSTGIPIGILERSIKLTNEPPQGLKQNLKRAFASFDKEEFEFKDPKIKMITFGLCHFHAVIIERIKFGPKGWNRPYPFNIGDLMNSATILQNYIEGSSDKIPWADLRYMFGEIMYGGHITDDLDRLLCKTYLEFYVKELLLDEMELFPFSENFEESFRSPPVLSYDNYRTYIDECLPQESPVAFGLHPNAEIAVKTTQAEELFTAILLLQPRTASVEEGEGEGISPNQKMLEQVTQILDMVKACAIDLFDVSAAIDGETRDPYQNVFMQECERMNILTTEIKRSLNELAMGLNGELQMSSSMDALQNKLFLGQVPVPWGNLAYPSSRKLDGWLKNLVDRFDQIKEWVDAPNDVPKCVNIAHFFNPQSFLTAIMQKTAQKSGLELDKLGIATTVTRKTREQTESHARQGGAYVCGLNLEGARWNWNMSQMEESLAREMFFEMPVIACHAILLERMEKTGTYFCPVYKTQIRGPTFVFTANLRSKLPQAKWILAGVVMVMEVVA